MAVMETVQTAFDSLDMTLTLLWGVSHEDTTTSQMMIGAFAESTFCQFDKAAASISCSADSLGLLPLGVVLVGTVTDRLERQSM